MDQQPSTSKKVKLTDPEYESQLLEWYNEVSSEDEKECNEDFALYSDHNTDSEEGSTAESDRTEERDVGVDEGKEMEVKSLETESEETINNEVENTAAVDVSEATAMYFYGKNRFKWSSKPPTSSRGRRTQDTMVQQKQPQIRIESTAEALTIWKLLFTDEICDIILKWTNRKISEERKQYKNKNSPTVKDIDRIELDAFFGLLAYTSVFKSNNENIDTIFATDGSGREIIRCIMSKERFAFLLICLRFDNPEDRIMRRLGDPTAAISQIFELFVQNCQKCYTLGPMACIDEMLVGFRGRCKFKIYLPSKPVKYGIKIMCCTDAGNGYFYNAYIYSGKDCDGNGLSQADKKYGKPTQSVLRLTQPLYKSNRNITFDNWFTSVELVEILKQRGLTCIGTIKKNKRDIPPEFLPQRKREVGTALYGFTKDITLLSYVPKINKAVLLLSSMHHHKGNHPESKKPDIIHDYNSTKGGVDAIDEKCAKFSSSRRTRRWPMAVFFRLFDISTVNAYILFGLCEHNPHIERAKFIQNLAFQLAMPHLERRSINPHVSRKLRLSIFEILGRSPVESIPRERPERLEKRKTCFLCPYKKKRQTAFLCYSCQQPICLECSKKLCRECVQNA